jgi:hypothetical protein
LPFTPHEAGSCDSDEDIGTDTDSDTDFTAASESEVHTWSRPQDPWNSGGAHPSIGGTIGMRILEAPHVSKDLTPIIALLLFMEMIQLIVADQL